MSDPFLRLLVVSAITAIVLALALLVRRGVVLRRRSVSIGTIESGLTVFVSSGCSSCSRVLATLEQIDAGPVRVVDWDEEPEVFMAAGIDRIPAVVRLDGSGAGWMVQGVPSAGQLRRWLRDP